MKAFLRQKKSKFLEIFSGGFFHTFSGKTARRCQLQSRLVKHVKKPGTFYIIEKALTVAEMRYAKVGSHARLFQDFAKLV